MYEGSTGSKVGIDAVRTKNNLEVESSIEVTPTVGQVSDRIKSGEYGAEVNKAVLDIDAEATDWILDPANNRVVYKGKVAGEPAAGSKVYPASYGGRPRHYGTTPYEAALAHCTAYGGKLEATPRRDDGYFYMHYCDVFYDQIVIPKSSVITMPESTKPDKYIPIDTVSAKIIANAEDGHVESKNLLVSVVSVLASLKLYDPLF